MRESSSATKTIRVGESLVNVVLDYAGRSPLYLEVGGASQKVLGVDTATNLRVVPWTTTPRGDRNLPVEVLADTLQNGKKLTIYRVEGATGTLKLGS